MTFILKLRAVSERGTHFTVAASGLRMQVNIGGSKYRYLNIYLYIHILYIFIFFRLTKRFESWKSRCLGLSMLCCIAIVAVCVGQLLIT